MGSGLSSYARETQVRGDEQVARHLAQGGQGPRVAHAAGLDLLADHPLAGGDEGSAAGDDGAAAGDGAAAPGPRRSP